MCVSINPDSLLMVTTLFLFTEFISCPRRCASCFLFTKLTFTVSARRTLLPLPLYERDDCDHRRSFSLIVILAGGSS